MADEPDFSNLPGVLRERVQRQWHDFLARAHERPPAGVARQLPLVWAASPFAAQSCLDAPELLGPDARAWLEPAPDRVLPQRVHSAADRANDEAELKRNLRRVRNREMVRIAWRELAGIVELETTLEELSTLADACLWGALRWLEAHLGERHGQPRDASAQPVGMVVLAMGKLGGFELNFSSDIDLIFAFNQPGESDGAKPLSNEAYFRKLARCLISVLQEPTEDGFVFRVDTRLRPFGDSGPLVMHFAAMEQYYQIHGRDWERYALIKARPAAGDLAGGEALLQVLRPFVYRRYLDFTAYESLRAMKELIEQQVARKGLEDNIKLGVGGIREVEFIAQALQLLRGGREPALRARGLLSALRWLAWQGLLAEDTAGELVQAYSFLRRVENCLQAWHDQQTHELPTDAEGRAALAMAMGYEEWADFAAVLARHRRFVNAQFHQMFASPQAGEARYSEYERTVLSLWEDDPEDKQAQAFLTQLGVQESEPVVQALGALRESALVRGMGERGRTRIARLMPLLFGEAQAAGETGAVLVRMLRVVETIAGRGNYIALLLENPTALAQLARLCAASAWIADYIADHPMLLDELLDPDALYAPPRARELQAELEDHLAAVADADSEEEMNYLRHFKQSHTLRVAAADITANMPLMVVSDHLTEIAEVVLRRVVDIAWDRMVRRYGRPVRGDNSTASFTVVAYGKLGGMELGYGSDLDLVFLHDGEAGGKTDGERPLEHPVFFSRMGQRIIHMLSTQTPAGQIYEVDMRLRPSGRAGLLVTSLTGYADYQLHKAWTWEHQALVKARAVSGSAGLGEAFTGVRTQVLGQHRDPRQLAEAVSHMRVRMRAQLEAAEPGRFDLKQGRGGTADIEFLVQFAVLRWAHERSALLRHTDNIRILEQLAAERLLRGDCAAALADAYRDYRARSHRLYLRGEPALVAESDCREHIRRVSAAWDTLLGESDA
jgi:glutamate-ammonia-ligase adenylyltransferase